MPDTDARTLTHLLEQLQGGDSAALDRLFPIVYEELRVIAHAHRQRWHGDGTLGTTALVHEAYVKLIGVERPGAKVPRAFPRRGRQGDATHPVQLLACAAAPEARR